MSYRNYNNISFDKAEIDLLSLAAAYISGNYENINISSSSDSVFDLAFRGGISDWLTSFADGSGFLKFSEKAKKYSVLRIYRNTQILNAHIYICDLFECKGIRFTILKGCASGCYYNDIMLRSYGDVDFLVSPDDFIRAKEILLSDGYTLSDDKHPTHLIFSKDGIRYEMHREPSGIPNGKPGKIVRSFLSDTIETSQSVNTELGRLTIPDKFHHGLILLLHTVHHLTAEGIGLRQLADWAFFINSLAPSEFGKIFDRPLIECGLKIFAEHLNTLCARYLGCAEYYDTGIKKEDIDALLYDILRGGNLGQNEPQRQHEALLISDHGKDGISKGGMLKTFIRTVIDTAKRKHPKASAFLITIPFIAFYMGIKYTVRSIKGKRPELKPFINIKSAKSRKDLYSIFQLFILSENTK